MSQRETSANFSNCSHIAEKYPDFVDLVTTRILVSLLYAVIFFLGSFGNLIVMYCLFCTKVTFHVRQIFVGSLAIADLLLLCFAVPVTSVQSLVRVWVLGHIPCRLLPFLQCVTTLVTSFTLTLMAIDRYVTINRPHADNIGNKMAVSIIMAIWVTAIIWSIPYGMFMGMQRHNGVCGVFCGEKWPNITGKRAYFMTTVCIQFVIPSIVFTICYALISHNVGRQVLTRLSAPNISWRSRSSLLRRKRNVSRMLLIMVGTFFLAWLPQNVLNVYRDFDENISLFPGQLVNTIFILAHACAMSSAICNPIIYSFCNGEFRRILKSRGRNLETISGRNTKARTDRSRILNDIQPTMTALREAEPEQFV